MFLAILGFLFILLSTGWYGTFDVPASTNYFLPVVVFRASSFVLRLLLCGPLLVLLSRLLRLLRCYTKFN